MTSSLGREAPKGVNGIVQRWREIQLRHELPEGQVRFAGDFASDTFESDHRVCDGTCCVGFGPPRNVVERLFNFTLGGLLFSLAENFRVSEG